MAYGELLARLYGARRAGVKLGLERIAALLSRLGHPEQRLRVRLQIGGTNGKGSTAAFTEAMVRAAGYRTGLYSSPHLSRFQERFLVDGQPAAAELLVAAGEAVAAAGGDELTFFEQVTAMAAWAFAEAGVEVAVLEVGLGGRLDATSALDAHAAAVTGVALDHQAYLGDTLEAIAGEKAAIFRAGRPAVIGRAGLEAGMPLLEAAARAVGARVHRVTDAEVAALAEAPIGLPGAHQRANAACAVALLDEVVADGGLVIDARARAEGLASAFLPGRFETIAIQPRVVVDGAHNPHAAEVLARVVRELPTGPLVVVCGVSADKDVAGVVAPLLAVAEAFVATQSRQTRALPAAELAAVARTVRPEVPAEIVADVPAALERARALAGAEGTVLCAGSLFVVGEAREALLGVVPDAIRLADPL